MAKVALRVPEATKKAFKTSILARAPSVRHRNTQTKRRMSAYLGGKGGYGPTGVVMDGRPIPVAFIEHTGCVGMFGRGPLNWRCLGSPRETRMSGSWVSGVR